MLPAAACRTRVEATFRSLGLNRNASWLLLELLLVLLVLVLLVVVAALLRLPHRLRVVKRHVPVDNTQYTSPASASLVQMPDTCST
jgi:fumarate reductase subunit D